MICSASLAGRGLTCAIALFVALSLSATVGAQYESGPCDVAGCAAGCDDLGASKTRRGGKFGCRKCLAGRHGKGCRIEGSAGDGRHCGRPAPRYPVPFATPRPTVPTYFTYPPMMPHHSLPHYRNVYSYRHSDGLSRTTVNWQPSYAVNGFKFLHHLVELPR